MTFKRRVRAQYFVIFCLTLILGAVTIGVYTFNSTLGIVFETAFIFWGLCLLLIFKSKVIPIFALLSPHRKLINCPSLTCSYRHQLSSMVQHLNDRHGFSFNEIAQWLERSGNNVSIKTGENGLS